MSILHVVPRSTPCISVGETTSTVNPSSLAIRFVLGTVNVIGLRWIVRLPFGVCAWHSVLDVVCSVGQTVAPDRPDNITGADRGYLAGAPPSVVHRIASRICLFRDWADCVHV